MLKWIKSKKDSKFVKVYVDLPNNEDVGGESMWAEDLGENLYRIRNTPFSAYGINFYDVVYAKANSKDLKPSIIRVHEYEGHKTLRVIFLDESSLEERIARLKSLSEYKAYFENANDNLFAIDIEPEGNYEAVYDLLLTWEKEGILSFETCESICPYSFDSIHTNYMFLEKSFRDAIVKHNKDTNRGIIRSDRTGAIIKDNIVFTTKEIISKNEQALHVLHNHEGNWEIIGSTSVELQNLVLVSLDEIIDIDPSLKDIRELLQGQSSTRDNSMSSWT